MCTSKRFIRVRLNRRKVILFHVSQVVQEPSAGLSQSTSSVYIDLPKQATSLYQPQALMSPTELRQHMMDNKRTRAEAEKSMQPPQLQVKTTGPDICNHICL